MGFFQSLKEDLSMSVNELISPDPDNDEMNQDIKEEMLFSDGEALLSNEINDTENGGAFMTGSYEENVDDLLKELESIGEAENMTEMLEDNDEEAETSETESTVRDALNSLIDASIKREEASDTVSEDADNEDNVELKQMEFDIEGLLDEASAEEVPDRAEADTSPELNLAEKILAFTNSEISSSEKEADEIQENSEVSSSEEKEPEMDMHESDDISDLLKEYQQKIINASKNTEENEDNTAETELQGDLQEVQKKETMKENEASKEAQPETDNTDSEEIPEVKVIKVNSDENEAPANNEVFPTDSSILSDENNSFSNETAVISSGMKVSGNIISNGNLNVAGVVNGDIEIKGKLDVTGEIQGNSKANEVFIDEAEVAGNINALGSIKIGQGSVIIGNITGMGAVIAGAVKGDIDVKGPVILDSSAIIMGNIKSMSVQINNGAVIEGLCSQCYAEINPMTFFDELKKK